MKNFKLSQYLGIVALVAVSALAPAQTYTDMFDFNNTNGCCANNPSLLAQGEDGNIYGAMTTGGTSSRGTIFKMTPSGTLAVLYNFDFTHGAYPQGGLSLGLDGNFYGTTYQGGANSAGTVFKITPGGTFTLLYSFTNGTDGAYPRTPPVQATDGNLYGTTGNGTVATLYKITPSGTFTVMTNLGGQSYSPLLLGTDGNFYGMTLNGGTYPAYGTAFQFSTKGKGTLKTIHNFNLTNGGVPSGPLMQAADGALYGTASAGGSASGGVIFKMTTGGAYTVLYNFNSLSPANGASPFGGLVQGSDLYLYGVASVGGSNNLGTMFKISTKGAGVAVVHNFDSTAGATPMATPLLHTNGKIYGLTFGGGSKGNYGVLYSMDAGLKPFASQFVYYSGKVGAAVPFLGQGFSTATGVKFGAGAGTFVPASDTFMTATVVAGGTTAVDTVLEPGGNLVTPHKFSIIPTISSINPTSGIVGTSVVITGMSLTQTSSVTFGGVKATFVMNSNTQVTATVPTGAKIGKVGLRTAGGSATSTQTFTVN